MSRSDLPQSARRAQRGTWFRNEASPNRACSRVLSSFPIALLLRGQLLPLSLARPPVDRTNTLTEKPTSVDLTTIVSLCKRRGFLFQSSEIYGGMANTWGLRAPGRRAQEQRQGRLVAGDGLGPRRRGGPGLRRTHAPQGLAGERPRRELHRPAGGVQELPPAVAGRPASRRPVPRLRR